MSKKSPGVVGVTDIQVRGAVAPVLSELALKSGFELERYRTNQDYNFEVLERLADRLRSAFAPVGLESEGFEPGLLRPFGMLARRGPDYPSVSETKNFMADWADKLEGFSKAPEPKAALELLAMCVSLNRALRNQGASVGGAERRGHGRTAPIGGMPS